MQRIIRRLFASPIFDNEERTWTSSPLNTVLWIMMGIAGAAVLWVDANHLLPSPSITAAPASVWWIATVNFGLAAVLFFISIRSTRRALDRARRSEAKLAQQKRELEEQTEALRKTNRAFKMLSACNQAVGRATEEIALLRRVCQIVVDVGGYRLAWAGLAEHDEEKSVRPIAQMGYEEGYLETINITWADMERGRGPTGTAIRTGRPSVIRHILTNSSFAPWRDRAIQRGYASSVALPLRADGHTFGALNVYAAIPDAFDELEVELLRQLADDVAYGFTALRTRKDREEKAKALRESELLYRTLFESAPLGLGITNAQGEIIAFNEAMLDPGGYTQEDISENHNVAALYFDAKARNELLTLARRQGFLDRAEVQFKRKDGTPYDVLLSLKPVKLKGEPHWQAVVEDITEREQMLLEVQKRAEELATLSEAARVVSSTLELEKVLQLIAQQLVMAVGASGCTLFHWDKAADAVITWIEHRSSGKGTAGVPGTAYPLSDYPATRQVLLTGQPLAMRADDPKADPAELALMRSTGETSLLMLPMHIGGEVLGLIELDEGTRSREFTPDDIRLCQALVNQAAMAIKNAGLLQETQAQAQRMEHILRAVHEGIILLDTSYTVLLANPVGQQILNTLAGIKAGETLTHLGGEPLATLLESASADGLSQEITCVNEQRFFEFSASQLVSGPQRGGWVLILREVTADRRRQQYQQEQARLATVGQLAAGVAHDFNNIMAVIMLYTELLLKTPELSPQNLERLSTIWQQARQAANLTSQILDFSRRSVMERSSFEFVSFLKEFLKLMERTLPENISINLAHDRKQYVVNGDPTRLQQVLMNLSLNGRDAMPDGGELHFTLSSVNLEATQRPPLPDMQPGDWLKLTISDTGIGVEARYLPHLFEPFFTTKAPGQGTGLGLAQAYGIVKQHDGHIDVDSRPGQGTTFTIYLPVIVLAGAASFKDDTFQGAMTPGNGETILVVEDDEATRKAVDDVLTSLGYHVLQAANGEKALTLFDLYGQKIDLVLSDLVMPGIGGEELFQTLRQTSKIKMVLMTGHPLDEKGQSLLEQGVVAWLSKPFTAEVIANTVHHALNGFDPPCARA